MRAGMQRLRQSEIDRWSEAHPRLQQNVAEPAAAGTGQFQQAYGLIAVALDHQSGIGTEVQVPELSLIHI